jgi:phenylpropionate dioxygenase-like ring-hydroxylating dioxygenase large terminal subunit/AcrR family transcriptional regulator
LSVISMAKSPALKSAARRRQLIDATITAIGRRGYASTTLTHVAGEAGLSPGIVNFYFKSKEQLLLATLEQITDEYAAFLREQMDKAGPSPAAQLEAMIDADFDPQVFTLEKVAVWYAFWAEAHSQPSYRALVSRMEAQYYGDTAEPCRRIIEAGGYAGIDPDAVASGLNAMIDGFWFDFLIDPKDFDREAAKRTCRLFLSGLFPREFQRRLPAAPRKRPFAPVLDTPTESLPASAYTDPAFFAREAAQLFPRNWQLVCHESDVAAPGDFATFDLLRDGAFVVRGEDGKLRAFLNVCRHRASRLLDSAAASSTGNCGHAVTCPYHGWSYDFIGHLKAVPAERSFAKIDWAAHGLLPLELELFAGFAFIRFGRPAQAEDQSVRELMAPYADEVAAYRLPEMKPIGTVETRRLAANWKTVIDDFRQGYEVALVHPALGRLFGGTYDTDVAGQGVARAIGRLLERPADGWSERLYQSLLPEIGHLPPDLQRSWRFYSLFPNTTLTLQPEQAVSMQVLPVGPEESLICTRRYALPQADRQLAAARYLAERIDRRVAREDDALLLLVQRGRASSHTPAGPIADSEIAVRQFHALLRRRLAVAEPVASGR